MDARVVPGRVRVAVRLRPRNAEELSADSDFADCVELQPEVSWTSAYEEFEFSMLRIPYSFCLPLVS